MASIGNIPIPPGFRYRHVLMKGKPLHRKTDAFLTRHPHMDIGKRAKIFAPFDALRGFDEALDIRTVPYETRRELTEDEVAEIDLCLRALHRMICGTKKDGGHLPSVSVTYFVPCSGGDSDTRAYRGQYHTLTGVCRSVDAEITRTVRVDETQIPFGSILRIRIQEPSAPLHDGTETSPHRFS